MCKTLKVSASGFYGWQQRPMCPRQQANSVLTTHIRSAFVASDETYGMPRIRAELQDAGIGQPQAHCPSDARGANAWREPQAQLLRHY